MLVERNIMPERELAYFRMSGTLHTSESVDAFLEYINDPLFHPRFTLLTNATGLVGLNTNFVDVVRAAGEIKFAMDRFTDPVLSIVYCNSGAAFGMARVMQQVVEPMSKFRFRITRDAGEAMRAAGQSESDFTVLDSAMDLKRAG